MQQALKAALRSDPRVQFGYLFGSRAHGTEHDGSDVDVAVWLDAPHEDLGAIALALTDVISRAAGKDADVVVLNRASVLLRSQVIRHGQLLLERDRTQRVSFEALTLQQAIDFEPIRRRCAEGMLRKLRQEAASTSTRQPD